MAVGLWLSDPASFGKGGRVPMADLPEMSAIELSVPPGANGSSATNFYVVIQ
jgi:hypothetical protein